MIKSSDLDQDVVQNVGRPTEGESMDAAVLGQENVAVGVSMTDKVDAVEQTLILSIQHIFALSGMAFSAGAVRDLPEQISETFPNQRWRKFLPNLALAAHKKRRVHYGRMLCRDWNEERTGDDRLATLQMIYMQEVTPPPDETDTPVEIEKIVLWKHKCF